jgi:LCP family protein required for cell wall assembly
MDSTAKTVAALTIPRDVWLEYPELDQSGKIGDANLIGGEINYPGGSAQFAVKTVEKLTGLTIPYYIRINQDAFTTLIDEIGPLEVCPAETIHDEAYQDPVYGTLTVHFDPGCQRLDSVGLLQYVTVRHSDSDFARSARQLEVLLSLRDQVITANNLPTLVAQAPALWDSLQGNLTTNLTPDELLALAYVAKAIPRENIHQGQLTLDQLTDAVSPLGEAILIPDASAVQQVIEDLFGGE